MTRRFDLNSVTRASALALITLVVAACSSTPKSPGASSASRAGGYYKDDGPPTALPADLDRIPDAVPRDEPLHRFANRPYNVFGVNYTPLTLLSPLKQRGVASWYGRKFHGQKTAIGETYDMFAMTAAHPTAPLPSYARVTHVRNGRSVIVRINDRGPFHPGRVVDLSYAAAHRIGVAQAGSGEVEFELLLPPQFAVATAESAARAPTSAPAQASRSDSTDFLSSSANAQSIKGSQRFFVQLGAFGNFNNARAFQWRMAGELGSEPVVRQVNGLFRVQLGPFANRNDAEAAGLAAQQRVGTPLPIVTDTSTP